MVKYSQTTRNSDGGYETRVHTDYTQTAAEGIAGAAGTGIAIIFQLIFMSKITLGSTLIFISLFVFGASAGWGFILLLTGGGFIAWWFHQRSEARAEEERVLAAERSKVNEANRKAQRLAQSHAVPPTAPVISLAAGEVELTRFWTKQSGKAVATSRRLVIDQSDGAVTMIRIPDITGVSLTYEDDYNAIVHIPTVANPKAQLEFSSRPEAQRILETMRSAILGGFHSPDEVTARATQTSPPSYQSAQSAPSASPTSSSATSSSGQPVQTIGHAEIRTLPNNAALTLAEAPTGSTLTLQERVEWSPRPLWIKVSYGPSGTVGYVKGTSIMPA